MAAGRRTNTHIVSGPGWLRPGCVAGSAGKHSPVDLLELD